MESRGWRFGSVAATLALAAQAPAQVDWRNDAGSGPAARFDHAIASDPARGRVVLFGGRDLAGSVFGDTWEWDGSAWTRVVPPAAPPARHGHSLAWDAGARRVVLFGGCDALGVRLGDTWVWDGASWSANAGSGPAPRVWHACAGDANGSGLLLFGGQDAQGGSLGDTWQYAAGAWTRTAVPGPSARWGHELARDAWRARVLCYGGNGPSTDTWEWDGAAWQQRSTQRSPGRRLRHVLAFDPVRSRSVLWGGLGGPTYAYVDTWDFDGAEWVQRSTPSAPAGRIDAAIAFDTVQERLIVFGGLGPIAAFGDTWSLGADAPASVTSFGQGCAGSHGVPAIAPRGGELPWTGASFLQDVTGLGAGQPVLVHVGFSNTVWTANGRTLPLLLGAYGMPGCTLYSSPDVGAPLPNPAGVATLALAIPDNALLVGIRFYTQAIAFDPAANAGGAVFSNATDGLIGAR